MRLIGRILVEFKQSQIWEDNNYFYREDYIYKSIVWHKRMSLEPMQCFTFGGYKGPVESRSLMLRAPLWLVMMKTSLKVRQTEKRKGC